MEGGAKNVASLLQSAATEYEIAGDAVGADGLQGASLSVSLLSELYDILHRSGSGTSELDGLWEELARKEVSMGSIVGILSGTMQIGGIAGVKAAEVYLCLLLSHQCPVYSLFSQMAFDAFARCLRNSCKRRSSSSASGDGENPKAAMGRKGQKKGKRSRDKERHSATDAEQELDGAEHGVHCSPSAAMEVASVQDILTVLSKLQRTLLVLHLRDRQETLKLITELLVDMLHLLSDMKEVESGQETGGRLKKRSTSSSPRATISDTVFSTMERLLNAAHGQPLSSAIKLLRELTPTILLTHAGGSTRVEARNCALQFVTRTLLRSESRSIRPAAVALPRYLCFKAPEKTEGRSLAVESVITLLQALDARERCRFAQFLCKFSHSKPRHRLVAVDVALAMLGGLPDALNCGSGLESLNANSPSEFQRAAAAAAVAVDANQSPTDGRHEVDPLGIGVDCNMETPEGELDGEDARTAQKPLEDDLNSSPEAQWWGIACIEILLHRSSDKVPAIRARALTNLAQAIELIAVDVSSRRQIQFLLGFCGNGGTHGVRIPNPNPNSVPFNSMDTPILGGYTPSPEPSSEGPTATPLTPGAGHRDLWSLLQRRCSDDKVAVRKATLILMKKSTTLLGKAPEDAILQAMGAACGDQMISIRKAALAALSEVLRRFPGEVRVGREWLKSALQLAFDNETTLQDECLNLFEELVLDRISVISTLKLPKAFYSKDKVPASQLLQDERDMERLLPVGTLNLLKEMADGSTISSCVKRICSNLGKKKRLRAGVALALQNLISSHRSPHGAWFLLSEVTAFVPKAVGWEFLRTHWQLQNTGDSGPSVEESDRGIASSKGDRSEENSSVWAVNRVHLLQTISNVAVELPPDAAADLATELLERLETFNMHPAEVGAHIKALAILCKRKAVTAEEGDELVIVWVKRLLEQADRILQAYIKSAATEDASGDAFRTPYTSSRSRDGDLDCRRSQDDRPGRTQDAGSLDGRSESAARIVTVIFTVGAFALICPQVKAGHVVTLLQTLIAPAKDVLGQRKGGEAERIRLKEKLTPEVYVHVWVALGKLCLADDGLAKRCIPLFVQELGMTKSAAVRNNIMIVMTDFCVRYTALVDGYIHDLTRSLRDSCELVRRQAFVLLSRLLQRDYVKWRGMLFHRFLLTLVDDSQKICQLAKFVFTSILKQKAPLLAYNSFVEAIFVLNDCLSQTSASAGLPESERTLFSLRGSGEDVVEKRMRIYTTLLQQMTPEHLLATSAKLCAEVLAAAADGLLDLNDGPSQCVLQDALLILASKELRSIGSRGPPTANAELEEEDGGTAAAFAAAKGRVVTQLMKKNLVQNAVPIFIELKRLLESKNSPLLGLLMESMRLMLKDYKNEIEEILVADKQLQKEILYDMQKHEAAKARAKVAAAIPIIHKDCQQAATPGSAARTPAAANARSATAEQAGKSAQDDGRSVVGEKENFIANVSSGSGGGLIRARLRNANGSTNNPDIASSSPALGSMRKSALGNLGRAGASPRVTWEDRTPRARIYSAMPGHCSSSSISRLQSFQARTPHPLSSQFRSPDPLAPSAAGSLAYSSPEATSLAGAVADVTAAANVATVLQQVALKNVTPLRVMSLPRLKPSIPRPTAAPPPPTDPAAPAAAAAAALFEEANSALRHRQRLPHSGSSPAAAVADADSVVLSQCLAGEESGLETVRRRQSFSSIDDPCGLPPPPQNNS